MTAQTEFMTKAYEQVFEGFRKTAESAVQMQHELFRQWTAAWPGFPKPQGISAEQVQNFQKEWTLAMAELTRKYQELWDRQYKAGLESVEGAWRLSEAKNSDELRLKMTELWQKSFDSLKDLAQIQMRNFQTAVEKWMELARKTNPT